MKKKLIVLMVIMLLMVGSSVAIAGNMIKVYVNGKQVISDQQPFITNGRTMVPLRFVAEALGAEVNWDGATESVLIEQNYKPFTQEDFLSVEKLQTKHGIVIMNHLEYDKLSAAHTNLLTCVINLTQDNTNEGNARYNKAIKQLEEALIYELAAQYLIESIKNENTSGLTISLKTYSSIREDLLEVVNDLGSNWTLEDILSDFNETRITLDSLGPGLENNLINSSDEVSCYLEKYRQ